MNYRTHSKGNFRIGKFPRLKFRAMELVRSWHVQPRCSPLLRQLVYVLWFCSPFYPRLGLANWMGCLLQLLASTLMTENSAVALDIAWLGIPLHNSPTPILSAVVEQISLGTIKLAVAGNADKDNASQCHLWCPVWGGAVSSIRPNSWGFRSGGLFWLKTSWHPPSYMTKWLSGCSWYSCYLAPPVSTVYAAGSTHDHALNVGVQRKLAAHLSDCRAAGRDFVPIVVGTLEGLSKDAIFTVWKIGKAISIRASPDNPSTGTSQLFHYLICGGGGNACLWLHSIGISPSLLKWMAWFIWPMLHLTPCWSPVAFALDYTYHQYFFIL